MSSALVKGLDRVPQRTYKLSLRRLPTSSKLQGNTMFQPSRLVLLLCLSLGGLQ
jgi:hypothetical protein